jgi:hypothetical protein
MGGHSYHNHAYPGGNGLLKPLERSAIYSLKIPGCTESLF